MDLFEKIEKNLRESIKNKDSLTSETLRMIKTDIMYEKSKSGNDLTNEQVIEVLQRSAKKRKEAIAEFDKAGRTEMSDKEKKELDIISEYLPEQMSEDKIEEYISDKLKSIENVTKNDFGKVMGSLMKELKGKADGGIVRKVLTRKFDSI